ncbi:MAG: STAS domain-containing protein [Actinomycetota bacterium]
MFEVTTSVQRDWAVVAPIGDLDLASAPALRRALIEAVTAHGGRVVVDLRGAQLIDSQGLGTLVAGLKRARSRGGDLRLSGLGPEAVELFALTSLDRAFTIGADVDDVVGVAAEEAGR